MSISNVIRNATRPSYFPVMARKVAVRFTERDERDAAREWARLRVTSAHEFAEEQDVELWRESVEFGRDFANRSAVVLAKVHRDLGGGGHYPLVYFLVRLRKPVVVLETGVAAGWTSGAILHALSSNGAGELYSSDFPYFRFSHPEDLVGCLVDEELKEHWHLGLAGDARNLREFLPRFTRLDFVHYDSDKSKRGREQTLQSIEPKLSDDAIVMMDDVQDNLFFAEWIERTGRSCRVFEFEGKYVGLTGL